MRKVMVVAILLLTLIVQGCTALRPLDYGGDPQRLVGALEPGQMVAVNTRQGEKHLLTLTSVTPDALTGDGMTIPLADITAVRTQQVSASRTAGAVVATSATVVVVYGILLILIFLAM